MKGKAVKVAEGGIAIQADVGSSMVSMIERIMVDPSLPIERVEQAFAFYQKVQADQARKDFTASMVAAQAEMEPVRKDATNPQTRSKYATFEALDAAARPIYSKHGFAPTYRTEISDKLEHVRVVMCLMHIGGHEREYQIDMPADGKGAKGGDVMTKTHATGSAFSYGKRYVFGGAFNLITTEKDDDGNAAGQGPPITEDQVIALRDFIIGTESDETLFCRFLKIAKLSDLPASRFGAAMASLQKKAARR